MGRTMTAFKCRAECMRDVGQLLLRIHAERIEVVPIVPGGGTPDVVLTIEDPSMQGKALDLATLRAVLRILVDSHIMEETLATVAEYTGERTYGEPVPGKT